VAKTRPVWILHHRKRQFPLPCGLGTLFAAALPCHSILVLFTDKLLEPAVVTLLDAVQKTVAFDFVLLQHLRGICFCVPEDVSFRLASEELNLPSPRTFDRSWTAPRFCCSVPCHTLDCYTSILADNLIGFPFFLSVAAVRGRPIGGCPAISVFPRINCFTHRVILIGSIQALLYAP